ncbi:MAG: ABC transporter permease subunit [Treponema sp.]|nr:ABC transporter permease subunit [Treponema sp.]
MNRKLAKLTAQKYLYLMVLPGFLVVFIFHYIPIYGVLIAFQNFDPRAGIWGSEWIGLTHFRNFFSDPMSFRVIKNTLLLGIYSLLWSFPVPIILALLFNELKNPHFKKVTQTISYFPHFLSVVIVAGMLRDFASRDGLFNQIRLLLGMDPVLFFLDPIYFRTLFIISGIWQGAGFGTIIYLAAISGVDPTLYDVAAIDGANRFKKALHITIPHMRPTVTILLIFAISGILGTDFQRVLLLYHPGIYSVADVIGTYTFRVGLVGGRFEFTAAIGLFNSVVAFVLLLMANFISRKVSDTSLW